MSNFQPDPIDESLLRFQADHISTKIWEGEERLIRPRSHSIWCFKHEDQIDDHVQNLMNKAGFGNVLSIGKIEINHHLISALVERWRTETHTFHFSYGEAMVTLEDIALQLGLNVDENAVTGHSIGDLRSTYEELLGVTPPKNCIKGYTIYLSWLNN